MLKFLTMDAQICGRQGTLGIEEMAISSKK